jgi:hypothetical protein
MGQAKKRIHRGPRNRESKNFHSTWVKQRMPAMENKADTVEKVVVTVEAAVETLLLPYLAMHWSKGHAKTLIAMSC